MLQDIYKYEKFFKKMLTLCKENDKSAWFMGEKQKRCQNAQKFIKNLFTYSLYCQKKVCYNKISNNKVQCDLCNSYCAKKEGIV